MVATRQAPPPPKAVLDYLEAKGVKPAWSWLDVWQEEHLAAFTVAGLMEADMLMDMKDTVALALREGLPFAKFKKLIEPILADKGWLERRTVTDPITGNKKDVELGNPRRLKTIFDTNVRTARAAGQWNRIDGAKGALPYLEYRLGPSRVHRDEHIPFDGLILPVSHPFWNTHFPPNGFGCKCSVRQISEREARSKGGPHAAPALPSVSWTNPRTGQKLNAPLGVDPGFAFNPGKTRLSGLR